jgi:hypothetical protein
VQHQTRSIVLYSREFYVFFYHWVLTELVCTEEERTGMGEAGGVCVEAGIEGQVQRNELVLNDEHQCRAATEEFEAPRTRPSRSCARFRCS